MKRYWLLLLSLLTLSMGFSQNNKLWKGYFSYNEIKDLSQSTSKVFAASENAFFSQDILSGTIKTTNTIDGLSGQTITSFYHSPTLKKSLIGYENGLMIVINEVDGSMLNVVDIINKSIPQNVKKINHFMEYNGIVYVSCDFGIVQYNLATLQFGDTYFIGYNGNLINITQSAVFEGKIYAATRYNGILSAEINNPNLNDYNQWTTIANSGWSGIETFGTNLIGTTTTGSLQKLSGTTFVPITQLPQPAIDLRSNGTYLTITTKNHVYTYNSNLIQTADINSSQIPEPALEFTCATVINDLVFIGTKANGLFSKSFTAATFDNGTPDGPFKNAIFAINASTNNLWAVYGGYNIDYNPFEYDSFGTVNTYGISKLKENGWLNIPYSDIQAAVGQPVNSLVRITVNPNNENQVYVSSYHSGLLKVENEVPTLLYDENNSGLDPMTGTDYIRTNGTAFDDSGNLWVTNARVAKGLKVFKTNGQWQAFTVDFSAINVFETGRLIIDKNGTKWMTTVNDGVLAFNERYNNRFKTLKETSDTGNLPINDVRAMAIDNRDQLWIGTRKGLRVLSSVDDFLSDVQMTSDAIIILEENLAQELLYEQSITDIFVDGANNKWIGTADSGVFLVSADGQKTIYHFTSNNSPLPSNNINDIDINGFTGEVFFATTKGMVSFKGISTLANDNLNNVFVYPNPVRPEFTGTVKVSGLMDKVHVKITDIEGNLVNESISEGGTIEWDTTAFGKYKVASGVYMIFVSSDDGAETKVKKVMIIR